MQNLQARLSRLAGRRPPQEPDAAAVLPGLSPRLVIHLARLAGHSIDDLQVTLQLLPWGDRATLAAYGVVELEGPADRAGRGLQVAPLALDVVAAAAELVASTADPAAVARAIDERSAASHEPDATEPAAGAPPVPEPPRAALRSTRANPVSRR